MARWKFRRQHPVDRYVVDFISLAGHLVVEVDGVTHATSRQIRNDLEREAFLETCGFHVVRVSNTDVYENLDGVLQMIAATLNADS